MQWWCSATGQPWTWAWQWYPGIHLFAILVAVGWWRLGERHAWPVRPWGWFIPGWLVLLGTFDWPLGKLGAGYLASAHSVQFLLLTLVVGPCLLKSIPPEGWSRLAPEGTPRWFMLQLFSRAIPGLLAYDLIVITTHFPLVVDSAMTTQLGSMAIDLSWLAAGLFLWWPILAPPAFVRLGTFGMMAYIFGATIVPTIPAMMMVFSDWPVYRLYELAPRASTFLTANRDIQLAGLIMKIIGDIPMWIALMVIFFRGTAEKRVPTHA